MNAQRSCAACGVELPADAAEDICPKCLLKVGIQTSSGGGGSGSEHPTVPPSDSSSVGEATLPPHETGSSSDSPSPGTKVRYFGDYELLEEVARGGMGVVYKARQVSLNRIVALKMILAGQLASEAEVQRFHTEAEAAAKLDHPGIVPIYEVGQHEGQHYFSMGFVDGPSLADRLVAGPLSSKEAAELTQRLAESVTHAHEHGIIHRDLKPANILLDSSGQPRITDFGLAKKFEVDSHLTGTGQILGTPSYMPPEQAAGRTQKIGPTADVYSLGAVLYAMLTSRPPFQAANPMDTLLQVLDREPVPPRQLDGGISRDLETICLKCLAKEMDRRYSSADELAAELRRFIAGEPIRARPISAPGRVWRWCKRRPAVASLVALVLLLLVGGTAVSTYFALNAMRERDQARLSLARNYWNLGVVHRDGKQEALKASHYFARSASVFGDSHADSRNAQLASHVLTHTAELSAIIEHGMPGADASSTSHAAGSETMPPPEFFQAVKAAWFTPDGTRILTIGRDDRAWWWNAKSGAVMQQFPGRVNGAIQSRDGKRLLIWAGYMFQLWSLNHGEAVAQLRRAEWVSDDTTRSYSIAGVSFSGDGSRILCWGGSNPALWTVWDASTGKRLAQVRTPDTSGLEGALFSHDGNRILTWNTEGTVRLWDVDTSSQLSQFDDTTSFSGAVLSREGSRLLTWYHDDGIARLWDAVNGKQLVQVRHDDTVGGALFNRDVTRILTLCADGSARLWDVNSGEQLAQFQHRHYSALPVLSGDETRVLTWNDSGMVWLRDITTGDALVQLEHEKEVYSAFYTADDSRIVTCCRDGKVRLWGTDSGEMLAHFSHESHEITNALFDGVVQRNCGALFGSDESRILSWSGDAVRMWDIDSGEVIALLKHEPPPFEKDEDQVHGALFNADESRVLSWTAAGFVRLWDPKTSETVLQFKHRGSLRSALFNHDGSHILTSGLDGTVRLTDVDTGETLVQFSHDRSARGATFCDDERRILSWGTEGTAWLWDIQTGQALKQFQHDSAVYDAMLSVDETRVLSCSGNSVYLWDAKTAGVIGQLRHGAEVRGVTFSKDERRILSWSSEGTVKLWDIGIDHDFPRDALVLQMEVRTGTQLSESGELRSLSRSEWLDRKRRYDKLHTSSAATH